MHCVHNLFINNINTNYYFCSIRHLGADLEAQEAQHVAPSAAQIVHSIVNPGQWDHFRVRVRMDQLRFSPLFSVNRTESFVIVVYLTTFRM